MDEVHSRYSGVRCRDVAGGESTFGGPSTYPVCEVQFQPQQLLFFGGDPIRSFTVYSRSLPSR